MDRRVTRRTALGLGAAGVSGSIAGCSKVVPLTGPSVDSEPEKSSSEGRTEFLFIEDDEDQLAIVLQHHFQNREGVFEAPLDVQVFHNHEKLNIDSIELAFKPLIHPRPDIFWKALNSDWTETRFEETGNGWTTFSASDLGFIGQGSFVLEFYLRFAQSEEPEMPVEIGFQAEVELARDRWLGGSTTVDIFDSFKISTRG